MNGPSGAVLLFGAAASTHSRSSKLHWPADLQPSHLTADQAPHFNWQSLRRLSVGYEFRERQHCLKVTRSTVRMKLVVLPAACAMLPKSIMGRW